MAARRRERDESRVFKKMGDALSWINTNESKPFYRERSNRATFVGENRQPYQKQFIPGRGHVTPSNLSEGAPGGTSGIVRKSVIGQVEGD